MNDKFYYLMTFLPPLDGLGNKPPLSMSELLGYMPDDSSAEQIARTMLLGDDLLQRDGYLAGEIDKPSPTVLSVEQVTDEAPLPEALAPSESATARTVPGDAIWSTYFHYADRQARQLNSTFLAEWVRFEVSLRNALAEGRARALDLEPAEYKVANELGGDEEACRPVVQEWASAENPLAGQRILDEARWKWIGLNDQYYTFRDDELAAYAARLLLMERWARLAEQDNHHQTLATA